MSRSRTSAENNSRRWRLDLEAPVAVVRSLVLVSPPNGEGTKIDTGHGLYRGHCLGRRHSLCYLLTTSTNSRKARRRYAVPSQYEGPEKQPIPRLRFTTELFPSRHSYGLTCD